MPEISIIMPPANSPGEKQDARSWIAHQRSLGKSTAEIREAFLAIPRIRPTKKQAEKEAAKIEDSFLDSLGIEVIGQYENGSIEIYSHRVRKSNVIRDVGRVSLSQLVQYGGKFIETKVTEGPESGGMKSLRVVRNMIAAAAAELPNMTADTKRGAGCWLSEASGSILMVGDREISILNGKADLVRTDKPRHDGQLYKLDGNPAWYRHDDFAKLLATIDSEKTVEDSAAIFGRWRWQFATAPQLITGLVMATWVQTMWGWRPQIVATGEKSTGKSIFFRALKNLFAGLAVKTASDTTPKGLMKHIGSSAKIVLIDELDKNKYREALIEMVRASSRGDDERITYYDTTSLQQSFWMAGIESGLLSTTDSERFVKLEMLPRVRGVAKIREPSLNECRKLGQSLLAVAIRHARDAIRLADELSAMDIGGVETRILETYAPAAAMYAIAAGISPRGVIESFVANHESAGGESDFHMLAAAILGAHVHAGSSLGQRSIKQLIDIVRKAHVHPSGLEEAEAGLDRCGINVVGEKIRINQTDVIRHLLRQTQFQKSSISEILLRQPGAESVKPYIGKTQKRFVEMDLEIFCGEIIEKEAEEDDF